MGGGGVELEEVGGDAFFVAVDWQMEAGAASAPWHKIGDDDAGNVAGVINHAPTTLRARERHTHKNRRLRHQQTGTDAENGEQW